MASSGKLAPQTSPVDAYTGADGGTSGLCLAESLPRWAASSNALSMISGTAHFQAVYLPAGVTITQLGWATGSTGATTPTNQWLALMDKNLNFIAETADQLTAAIASNTNYQYPIAQTTAGAATSYTTTYSGLYYIVVCVVAATPPTVIGAPPLAGSAALNPNPLYQGTKAGYTGPPAIPAQMIGTGQSANPYYLWAT